MVKIYNIFVDSDTLFIFIFIRKGIYFIPKILLFILYLANKGSCM